MKLRKFAFGGLRMAVVAGAGDFDRHGHAIVCRRRAVESPQRVIHIKPDAPDGRPPVITAVAISPDGRLLAGGGDDHVVRIWTLADGQLLFSLHGHKDWIRTLKFSPDGHTLASAGDDGQIRLWDVASGSLLHTGPEQSLGITSLTYSPDAKSLLAVGFENQVATLRRQQRQPVEHLGLSVERHAFRCDIRRRRRCWRRRAATANCDCGTWPTIKW